MDPTDVSAAHEPGTQADTASAKRPVTELVRPTTVIEVPRLARRLGCNVFLATETFQRTGSFKFRAASYLVSGIEHELVITASSGNFGQALAHACTLAGKRSMIVMPHTSAAVKIEAVREYGGEVVLVGTRVKSRAEGVREIACDHPEAYIASAYDDALVIEGNATLGREIAALDRAIDCVVAPVGGGGLTSGIITGLRQSARPIAVTAAEPALANDAARSFRTGRLIRNESEPQTLADGARTVSLGDRNWTILKDQLAGVVEVSEEQLVEAVRFLFTLANLKAEPTGALSVGALLAQPELFRGRAVCCVISGGNVDPAVYRTILEP
jgi:threonine dehydratase